MHYYQVYCIKNKISLSLQNYQINIWHYTCVDEVIDSSKVTNLSKKTFFVQFAIWVTISVWLKFLTSNFFQWEQLGIYFYFTSFNIFSFSHRRLFELRTNPLLNIEGATVIKYEESHYYVYTYGTSSFDR